MTYSESMPVLDSSSSKLSDTDEPDKVACAQTWDDYVKVRFVAHIGRQWADALQSMRFEKAVGGKVLMSVASGSVRAYADQRHDILVACWQDEVPEVRDVVVNVRALARAFTVTTVPPALDDVPVGKGAEPITAIRQNPNQPPALSELTTWDRVKLRYMAQRTRPGQQAYLPTMCHTSLMDGLVMLDMDYHHDERGLLYAVHLKVLLECWQAYTPEATTLLIRQMATQGRPELTVTVDATTDADASLGELLHIALRKHAIAAGEDPDAPYRVLIEDIQRVVARWYKISRDELFSQRRTRNLVLPRQIAMYLAKVMTSRSYPEIGRRFGDRDHTTVLHSVRRMEERMAKDATFAAHIELLKNLLLAP